MGISELLDDLDFEAWLDFEGVTYRTTTGKHGREFNVRECPVCGGNEWKVYINERTNLGVCFHGSHPQDEMFNKYRFIKAVTDLSGRDLHGYLENTLHELGYRAPPKVTLESAATVSGKISLPSHQLINDPSKPLPPYLAERGVTHELVNYFDFRLCERGQHLYWNDHFDSFTEQDFSQRILIPIYNLDGELSTFQGRDITGLAEKKYLFPATLPASARFLYNGHNAIGKPTVIVGEGAFDVLGIKRALYSEKSLAPFVEPIGTFGMSLSGTVSNDGQDQIGEFLKLRHAGLKTVVMMWDTENKTINNLIDSAERLISIGLTVKVAALPHGHDPGDAPEKEIINAYFRAKTFDKRLLFKLKIRGYSYLLS